MFYTETTLLFRFRVG